jgi:hypothetical protein
MEKNTSSVKNKVHANWVKFVKSFGTYRTVNKGNWERASGIEPVKLLFDRSLQDMKQYHFS